MEQNVSVIIPTYNAEKYIGATIASLVKQGKQLFEIIVVDDGSSDATCEIIEALAQNESRIKLNRCCNNQGVSTARNIGINLAQADWVLFFDSDDLAEEQLLTKEFEWIEKLKQQGFDPVLIHTAYQQIDEAGSIISNVIRWKQVLPEEIFGYLLLRNPIVATSGVLVRRDVLNSVGGFDEQLHYSEDWDLWLRLAEQGGFGYVDEPLVLVRRHNHNVSKSVAAMLAGERGVLEKYSVEVIQQALFRRHLPLEVNWTEFAALLFRLELWEEGYHALNKALTINSKMDSGWFYLGIYYLKKQDWAKAQEHFEKTLQFNQHHGAALNNLGALLAGSGRIEAGLAKLNLALKLFPGFLDSQHNISAILASGSSIEYDQLSFTWRELRPVLLTYAQ